MNYLNLLGCGMESCRPCNSKLILIFRKFKIHLKIVHIVQLNSFHLQHNLLIVIPNYYIESFVLGALT